MARQVLDNGVILPSEYSDDWYDDMTSNLTKLDEVIGSDAEKLDESDVGAAAISNDYDDLDDKPTYNILRRASVTLTAGGTGNYTDLDSDSKIKAGDYVLDAANRLYSITAIDAANSTYTVSAAALFTVTDKAELGAAALSNDYDDLNNLPGYGILRFCSTAITDNSNVAFTNISSVSKIAAGDFLLDTAGKLYQISSVDTANETVSVTTPLTQLALDANVMHLSGTETVAGVKTFSDIPIFATFDGIRFRCAHNPSAYVTFRNANQANPGSIIFSANDGNVNTAFHLVDKTLIPYTNGDIDLGTSLRKWKSLNGINPGALSLPDLNNGIDISGYINTGDSDNSYTPLVDGYISVRVNSTNSCALYTLQGDVSTCSYGNIVDIDLGGFICSFFIPVVKNVACRIICRRVQNVVFAKFFPCQGNV